MSEHSDKTDAYRHRNLERIGQYVKLPAPAGADRQARWQEAVLSADGPQLRAEEAGASFMKRHKNMMLLTSGLAAGILVAVWLTVGRAAPVSAGMIFADFKAALRQSISIHIKDLDLGSVSVNGEIALDRAGRGEADETRYAEVHVLFKADNPDWNDLDGVLVICQSPEGAWQYVRGNGGSCARMGEVIPSEFFLPGTAWRDFVEEPLEQFGAMPLNTSFGANGSKVVYAFGQRQRLLIEQLLRFLLDLSNAETAEQAIDELGRAAGEVRVEQVGRMTYVLHAARFTRLGTLDLAAPEIPDATALVKQSVMKVWYNTATKHVQGTSITDAPGLSIPGILIKSDWDELNIPTNSPEELIGHLRERAADVRVDKSNELIWIISVTGYPLSVDTSQIEWQRTFVTKLRESLKLTIHYDAASHAVQGAEFRGLGSSDGCITLNVGQVTIDPRRLKSETWITPATDIGSSGR